MPPQLMPFIRLLARLLLSRLCLSFIEMGLLWKDVPNMLLKDSALRLPKWLPRLSCMKLMDGLCCGVCCDGVSPSALSCDVRFDVWLGGERELNRGVAMSIGEAGPAMAPVCCDGEAANSGFGWSSSTSGMNIRSSKSL